MNSLVEASRRMALGAAVPGKKKWMIRFIIDGEIVLVFKLRRTRRGEFIAAPDIKNLHKHWSAYVSEEGVGLHVANDVYPLGDPRRYVRRKRVTMSKMLRFALRPLGSPRNPPPRIRSVRTRSGQMALATWIQGAIQEMIRKADSRPLAVLNDESVEFLNRFLAGDPYQDWKVDLGKLFVFLNRLEHLSKGLLAQDLEMLPESAMGAAGKKIGFDVERRRVSIALADGYVADISWDRAKAAREGWDRFFGLEGYIRILERDGMPLIEPTELERYRRKLGMPGKKAGPSGSSEVPR